MLTAREVAEALEHGAPGVEAAYSVDDEGTVTFDDWPKAAGKAPTPAQLQAWHDELDATVTTASSNESTLRDRVEQALGNLQAAWDGWAGLTPAQKDAALKLQVRVTIALVRLVLRKLDAA